MLKAVASTAVDAAIAAIQSRSCRQSNRGSLIVSTCWALIMPVAYMTKALLALAAALLAAHLWADYKQAQYIKALEWDRNYWETTAQALYEQDYNRYGGYVPACGELPPLVGDDC